MSDPIKHECGIALLRLKKPIEFYQTKYGTSFYGINKLCLLMEKQHNRGQDGAGVANIKFDMPPGSRYISRHRSNGQKPIQEVFDYINKRFAEVKTTHPEKINDSQWLKENVPFTGELFLGHVRYGTFGKNSIENCHPVLRQNNWMNKNLLVAGNFNLTNVDELFDLLVSLGQHPKEKSDTVTVLEKIGHFLDEENEDLFKKFKLLGYSNIDITKKISENLNIKNILKRASADWDGGYAMAGLFGNGDAFVMRDPNGIRPTFYFEDEEILVVASERPVIQTAFQIPFTAVKELTPGHALIVKKNGTVTEEMILQPSEKKSCSFERIYFSRGSDKDIYQERLNLGRFVCDKVLQAINYDLQNTVFSFIPNTAEVAYYGMLKGVEDYINTTKKENILKAGPNITPEQLTEILSVRPRAEKIAIKDAKLRTFITQDDERDDMVAHIYDVTYGIVRNGIDSLVVIDDSIVRGTTLSKSVLKILDRLKPKKIIIVSSAPQIRYPDCYGIDMAKMGDFIAFTAAIELLKEQGKESIINQVYKNCKAQENLPKEQIRNEVKAIYAPYTPDEISKKITALLKPKNILAEVEIIFQSLSGLHKACPNHKGDWYFSGDYPTPGGNKVVNKSFMNYIEGKNTRAY